MKHTKPIEILIDAHTDSYTSPPDITPPIPSRPRTCFTGELLTDQSYPGFHLIGHCPAHHDAARISPTRLTNHTSPRTRLKPPRN